MVKVFSSQCCISTLAKTSKTLSAEEKSLLPSGHSIFKRLANFVLAVAIAFIILYLWLNNVIQDQQQLQHQANQLGKTISQQNAKFITDKLVNNELDSISQQLQYLQTDPHIRSVALFSDQGKMLLGTDDEAPIIELLQQEENSDLLVYVQEIVHEQKVIGYLRVLLWRDKVLQYYRQYQQEILYQAMLLVILALLVGVLLTRGFYKIKYKLD
ncbi:AhpA/YtjB family protein [Alteromonadaceae bacterium BrNp21-10]|nr:AhpA/YtjB family protein [Alteromonadaceae bacterium BrNp21-10]